MYTIVNDTCTWGGMDADNGRLHPVYMPDFAAPRHYLRAWREARGLTLEQVAERIELLGAERVVTAASDLNYPKRMTHASLSRIERGKQPYNQVLLELLAEIYQTDAASLLIRNPADPEGIWSLWERLQPVQRETALAMLNGLAGRTGTNG